MILSHIEKRKSMAEWLVRLKGQGFELEYLTHNELSEWLVFKEKEAYYLKSVTFNSLNDLSKIRYEAKSILEKINGLARLQNAQFQSVEIDSVTKKIDNDGKTNNYISLSGNIIVTSRTGDVKLTVVNPDGKIDDSKQPTFIENHYSTASQDINVMDVLRIIGSLENNWSNLYKVFEIVRDDIGGQKKLVDT